ncbi:Planctomycete cytochrome C [Maioricimonas rarisocia]|uniref:Planctomycete cytochrome C n=1 Tax=Maioricimonas rarisocia TaxID=2528026 RepID=A0A517Z5G8_9PLAN|nr:PSD1 and planctomycete cytochrome C domain-containing protein [Maioricimonas rarisocia]QDU37689.1 Planctomycete cytochrome C [Maioricimonas rarisocia]
MKLADRFTAFLCPALFLLFAVSVPAAADDYLEHVKPVLHERCYACHGALKQEGGLRLDTAEFARKGGDSGAAVMPRQPGESELLRRITAEEDYERMPPEGAPLEPEQIAAIRAWIEAGAEGPADEAPEADPDDHWAFHPPVRTALPDVEGDASKNPIDRILAGHHHRLGLKPLPSAERSLLLRRVSLDLTGLPPTRAELEAFLADDRPDAWERAVDRLLDSPQYGERWGRHWMDVWRYTDWYGLGKQLRYSQKHIWHWRDWIIESLNEDKGYDQMVLEMLAGDEIAPTDTDTLRATGFLARNYYLFNRTTWMDATIEHTSKAFLGLTMNCAKCHDHKYDPLSQVDYYRMRAFFEPYQVRLDTIPGVTDLEKNGIPRAFDAHPEVPTYLHIRGNEKDPDTSEPLTPGFPELLAFDELQIEPVSLPAEAHRPALRPFVLDDLLADAQKQIARAEQGVEKARADLEKAESASPADESPQEDFLVDEFDTLQQNLWEPGPGTWEVKDGVLRQTETGTTRRYFRTVKTHPADFEAIVRFRTLGGQKWKSVGLCFDAVDGREKMVYLSAVQPGSKLQVSYNTGSGSQYPPQGRKAHPAELETWYEMRVAVRGLLVNVSLNGEHVIAYRLPVPREQGRIDLTAFDAHAEFDRVEVRSLPAGAVMVEADGSSPARPELARAALAVAEANLEAARLHPEAIRTSWHADRARYDETVSEKDRAATIREAALATRRYEEAQARHELAKAEQALLAAAEDKKGDAEKAVAKAKKKLEAATAAIESPGETFLTLRASLKALEGPDETEESRRQAYPEISTGRRTALARWMIDRRNPLTARVAVNHIWLRHFGQPLNETVADFGRQAKAPPLQDLLDWLAVELMENDWSMKHMHRLIVTSRAYRMSTEADLADEATRKTDPQNDYFWRRVPVRMESQIVRDSILHLAGELNLELGGPTVPPTDQKARRRSLYFTHSRDDRHKFTSMFDDADIQQCYRRAESIIPQQALALANSRVSLEMARALATKMSQQTTDDETFLHEAFLTVLGREPSSDERTACVETLQQLDELLADRDDRQVRSRAAVIHALFNHNDFVTIR